MILQYKVKVPKWRYAQKEHHICKVGVVLNITVLRKLSVFVSFLLSIFPSFLSFLPSILPSFLSSLSLFPSFLLLVKGQTRSDEPYQHF